MGLTVSVLLIEGVHVVIACLLGLPYADKQLQNTWPTDLPQGIKRIIFFLFLKCKLNLPKENEKQKGLLLPLIFVFFWTKILATGTMSPMWFIWILLGVRRPGYVSLCFLYLLFCQIPSQVFFWCPVYRKSQWCSFLKFIPFITFATGKCFLSCLEAISF